MFLALKIPGSNPSYGLSMVCYPVFRKMLPAATGQVQGTPANGTSVKLR